MSPGNHEASDEWCDDIIARVKSYWGVMDDVYSMTALSYQATYNPERAAGFLTAIRLMTEEKILVINPLTDRRALGRMFGSASIVECPSFDAYSKIDEIENGVFSHLSETRSTLIVVAMGCSGRVLQKRILKKTREGCPLFVFDFGSLMDAISGQNTRAWMDISGFDKKAFLERFE